MSLMHELPERLWRFCDFPIRFVHYGVRTWLSLHLNPERTTFGPVNGNLQDWRGIGEQLGFAPIQIQNFQRASDPTGEVIRNLPIAKQNATIGDVLMAILKCERYDILEDNQLIVQLEKCKPDQVISCDKPELQDPDIGSSNDGNAFLTVGEADTGVCEYFDAFVCHSRADLPFVKNMMTELEDKQQFKLCIPERDFLPGPPKYEVITRLITERCDKFIVVLSPDFLKSDECYFMMHFTHSLDPNARKSRIIPIVYKECELPQLLNFICKVDYTRSDVIDWFWNRLSKSLKASKTQSYPLYTSTFNEIHPSIPPPSSHYQYDFTSGIRLKTKQCQDNFVEVQKTDEWPTPSSHRTTGGRDERKGMPRTSISKVEEDFIDISQEIASFVPKNSSSNTTRQFSYTQFFKSSGKKS